MTRQEHRQHNDSNRRTVGELAPTSVQQTSKKKTFWSLLVELLEFFATEVGIQDFFSWLWGLRMTLHRLVPIRVSDVAPHHGECTPCYHCETDEIESREPTVHIRLRCFTNCNRLRLFHGCWLVTGSKRLSSSTESGESHFWIKLHRHPLKVQINVWLFGMPLYKFLSKALLHSPKPCVLKEHEQHREMTSNHRWSLCINPRQTHSGTFRLKLADTQRWCLPLRDMHIYTLKLWQSVDFLAIPKCHVQGNNLRRTLP